jgi:hypothetical protein
LDLETSPAQEQQPVAENTEQAPQVETQPQQPSNGVQQRFDELTAKLYEEKRQREADVAARDAQISALIQTLAQAGAQQTQYQAPPQPELEPELRKQFDAYVSPQQRELQAMKAQMQQLVQLQEFNQVAQGFPPDIQMEAQKLLSVWNRNGNSGWKPIDALIYAAGQKAQAGNHAASAAQQQAKAFNQLPGAVTQQAAPAVTSSKKGLPSNFDSLPPQKKAEILEQETEDFPLF